MSSFFLRHVRLADKPWLKVLFANLLWEKNTAEWLADFADKIKRTGRLVSNHLAKIADGQ
jgi:hypothetical protein